jgi:Initiator Rep protein, WH2/Initiator Replication protein, WH1
MSRTIAQKTNGDGFPKAAEIIEITGGHELEAMDRAALNILYQHAHDSGRLAEPDAEFEIELARLRPSKHESNDRVRDALLRLMRVVVTIPYVGAPTVEYPDGEPRLILTPLFAFFDLSENEAPPATVLYALPKKLQPIIARSGRWGRIKAEVVCAMTSKYAIALYELVQLRANLQKCVETFPIDRFRELMGVPPGKLQRGNDFERRVLDTAALEVNGLSDCSVEIQPVRKSPKAPITAVTIAWWRKEGNEYIDTLRELQRPKVGRLARLKGAVEQVMPPLVQIADVTPAVSAEPTTPAASDEERNRQLLLDYVRRREEAGKTIFVDD